MSTFPYIENIYDVLPAIKDKKEFIVAEKEYFNVVNYVVMTPESFPPIKTEEDKILRECRGIIFNKRGELISRPFHKFFNLNEREETLLDNIKIGNYEIIVKEDGSMVRPVWIEELNTFWWCTKMGMSDTAVNADNFAKIYQRYNNFAMFCYLRHMTPLFEWCSPKNKIVLDYKEDLLVLLAVRQNYTGEYVEYKDLYQFSDWFDIPMVEYMDITMNDILGSVKQMTGIEGFVIRVNTPEFMMLKVKTDEYLRIHKARDTVNSPRALAELFVENKLDDIKPSLTLDDLKVVSEFEALISSKINAKIAWLDETFEEISNKYQDRKSFALGSDLDATSKSMIFSKMDGKPSYEVVLSQVSKHLSTQTKYDFLMEKILSV